MQDQNFFRRCEEQSEIKIRIVSKFFPAWARTIMKKPSVHSIGYVDLYAGPGRYDDGTDCTCLRVLTQAIEDTTLQKRLKTLLNDSNPEFANRLEHAVSSLRGIDSLANAPEIRREDVAAGSFTQRFASINTIPLFVFLDPWGIKGMTMDLIASLTKDWGSDCAFFFNFAYIRRAVMNPINRQHVVALFGQARLERLRIGLQDLPGLDQERLMLDELKASFRERGYRYIQTFRFFDNDARQLRHLVYVCKHPRGYEIMKEIMAPESTGTDRHQGIPNYEYHPMDAICVPLFQLSHPFDKLIAELPEVFAGQTLSVEQIYHKHNIETPYILKNYQNALMRLEQDKQIIVDRPVGSSPSTMGKKAMVSFPATER